MKIDIRARDAETRRTLTEYSFIVSDLLRMMAQEYKCTLPRKLILKPTRITNRPYVARFMMGQAGVDEWKNEWWISLNVRNPIYQPSMLDTIAHEVAHVIEARKYKKWGHSKRFYKIYEKSKQLMEKLAKSRGEGLSIQVC